MTTSWQKSQGKSMKTTSWLHIFNVSSCTLSHHPSVFVTLDSAKVILKKIFSYYKRKVKNFTWNEN